MLSQATATSPAQESSLEQEDGKRQQSTFTSPLDGSKEMNTQDTNQQPIDELAWVTGIRLLIIMGAICLVGFLMLLDTSIIATVRGGALIWFLFSQ